MMTTYSGQHLDESPAPTSEGSQPYYEEFLCNNNTAPVGSMACYQSTGHQSATAEVQRSVSVQYNGKRFPTPLMLTTDNSPWNHNSAYDPLWETQAMDTLSLHSNAKLSTTHSPQVMNLSTTNSNGDNCGGSGWAEQSFQAQLPGTEIFDAESSDTVVGYFTTGMASVHLEGCGRYEENFEDVGIEYDTTTWASGSKGQGLQNNDAAAVINAAHPYDVSQTEDYGGLYDDAFGSDNMHQFAANELSHIDHNMTLQDISPSANSTSTAGFSCPYLSCSSRVLFTRKCDLDKHYRQHFRRFYCRVPGCGISSTSYNQNDQSSRTGFATMKDRNRHEEGHNPSLPCHICGKLFSRYDNLRDHCRRRHGE